MNKKLLAGFVSVCALAISALAAPPNTPILNGLLLEYEPSELAGTFPGALGDLSNKNPWGPGNIISNVYVTWDEEYLYVALQGFVETVNANKVAVMIDADPGNNTGIGTTTNWSGTTAGYINFNNVAWTVFDPADFGADYMLATEGNFNNVLRILYDDGTPDTNNVIAIFDQGNGSSPSGSPVDMVTTLRQEPGTVSAELNGFEARIPWSVLYGGVTNRFGTVEIGEVVPRNASIKLFANLHVNDDGLLVSSPIVVPEQGINASYTNQIVTSDTYMDVIIDGDGDGFPDVAVGDVNPPWLEALLGASGQTIAFAQFNEAVDPVTVSNAANWLVDGVAPTSVDVLQNDFVQLNLAAPLPAPETTIRIEADGVEDTSGNSKLTANFLTPAASGLSNAVTVGFLLNVNSGFGKVGANPRSTNFFLNGGVLPLKFGFPPQENTPMLAINATQRYAEVTFPAGAPSELFYKYSGILNQTGTNTYEVIRLDNWPDVARRIFLDDTMPMMVVTDWLGAVGAPFRDPNNITNGYNLVYADANRGDAGVRNRKTVTFQLDLSDRDLTGVTRVLVQGTDPLRGFNVDGGEIGDFAGNGAVGWDVGGIELVDDGTLGDLVSGDGIFSRLWVFSTNGFDAVAEPGFPNSLVAGTFDTLPYAGFSWADRRSPTSVKYKFWVYRGGTEQTFEYPFTDIEYRVPGSSSNNIVLEPVVWMNDALPLPPPEESPSMVDITFAGSAAAAVFTNVVSERQHGLLVAEDLTEGFQNYGHRALETAFESGVWTARVENATLSEAYAGFAGPPTPFTGVKYEPYPVPETGATVRITYTQHSRALAGNRNVQLAGNWTGWNNVPLTFIGNGQWIYDLEANTNVMPNTEFKFKMRDSGAIWDGMGGTGGGDFFIYVGDLRASFSNVSPTNGEILTVTYDANGGPLAASEIMNAYIGFDEVWFDAGPRSMTNLPGETNIWELAFPIATNAVLSVNMVFNDGVTWDSESSSPPDGRQWRLFLAQPEE